MLGLHAGSGMLGTGIGLGRAFLDWNRAPAGPAEPHPALDRHAATGEPPEYGNEVGAGFAAAARAFSSPPQARRPAAAGAPPWDVLYARGHHLQLEGKLLAAAQAYQQAIRLNPEQAAVLYDLGYVLQLRGDTSAAIEYYRRAIAQQPRHAFAHYNLGTLLQQTGEAHAAITHYQQAAAIEPGNPYIYYDWARSLEALGNLAGAAALYRQSIALDPGRRPGLDARQRLAALAAPGASRTR